MRSTQKLINDEWKPVQFYSLQQNDYFRLFDNIAPVGHDGKYIYHATSNTYYDTNGNIIVDYEMC